MSDLNSTVIPYGLEILPPILIIIGLYFTFTFFEQLKVQDSRLIRQAKFAALLCFAAALLIPAVYKLYIYNEMMN